METPGRRRFRAATGGLGRHTPEGKVGAMIDVRRGRGRRAKAQRGWLALVALAGTLLGGCDSSGSDAERPVVGTGAEEAAPVTTIGLIVPTEGYNEAIVWQQVFRIAASRAGVLCEVTEAQPGKQADAVREAARRSTSALVVLPDPADPGLPAALAEVRDEGLPVLLLEEPVEVPGTPLPRVAFEPIEGVARRLVAASAAAAAQAGLPADAPAVVLVNGPFDELGRRRVAALHKALEETGIPVLPDAVFRGYGKEAGEALEAVLASHPDLGIVLAEEDQGARVAPRTRGASSETERHFIVGAFGNENDVMRMMRFNLFTGGLIHRDLAALGRRAFEAALAAARGGSVPALTEVPMPLLRPTGPPEEGFFPKSGRPSDAGVPLRGGTPVEEPKPR
jgi:ABC-type sugar transport system substrate-binding protein